MIEIIEHPLALTGFKALALLMLAFLATTLMRKGQSTAAHRSLVWVTTMMVLILLPLLAQSGPAWHLGIIQESSPTTVAAPALKSHPSLGDLTQRSPLTIEGRTASTEANPETLTAIPMPRDPIHTKNASGILPVNGLLIAWLVGFLAVMTTTLLGWLSLLRLQYQARDCFDEDLVSDLESVRKDLGIRRPIRLLISSRRDIPMTWGIFRPILHLPVTARQWNAQERRAVLIVTSRIEIVKSDVIKIVRKREE